MSFSSLDRQSKLEQMANEELDLLIVGGGITGAGIALDASVRGMDTGLIEMQDYASGTSSRSTKLVHGGLRYLKQFEVKLVAEVGKERAIVYENAPHVTQPEWMLLPIYKGGTFGKFSTSIGLKVYDTLAQVKRHERRKMLSRKETLKREPLLDKKDLKGSGYYVEYRTDDARLTIETIKEAVHRGVKAVNYTKAEELLYDDNRHLIGVKAVDQITGKAYEIKAKKIVNAAGPWVDDLREMDRSKKGKYLHLTKGIHIVIDAKRFPMDQAIYFDTTNGDGRMIFAIPREGKVYIGTTDTTYNEDPKNPRMTEADRDYVLEAINGMFPTVQLTPEDVESSWAGVRPLIHEEGKSPSEISRKDEIFLSDTGLLTIAGGKLTGYRKMAERIIDLVGDQLHKEGSKRFGKCTTDKIKLSGGDVGGSHHFKAFIDNAVSESKYHSLTETEAKMLAEKYGSNINVLYDISTRHQKEAEAYQLPLNIFTMLIYAIDYEMAASPVDFFTRRTGATLFNINWVRQWKEPVINYMSVRLGWTDEETTVYRTELDEAIQEASTPIPS